MIISSSYSSSLSLLGMSETISAVPEAKLSSDCSLTMFVSLSSLPLSLKFGLASRLFLETLAAGSFLPVFLILLRLNLGISLSSSEVMLLALGSLLEISI